jgi:hypothetical protein
MQHEKLKLLQGDDQFLNENFFLKNQGVDLSNNFFTFKKIIRI